MDPPELRGERLVVHERRLRLLLLHLMGTALRARVEPEDVAQEVWLRALAATAPLPNDGNDVWRLVARIARNTVVDIARAARASKRTAVVEPLLRTSWTRVGAHEPADDTAGPATRLLLAERQADLEAAFGSLAPEHRRVIGLRQFEGLSAAEAARRMGRSESAVHSLFRRALLAWGAILGDSE